MYMRVSVCRVISAGRGCGDTAVHPSRSSSIVGIEHCPGIRVDISIDGHRDEVLAGTGTGTGTVINTHIVDITISTSKHTSDVAARA